MDTPFNLFGAAVAAGADAVVPPPLELFGSMERPLVGIRCSAAAVPALFFGGQVGFFFTSRSSSSSTLARGAEDDDGVVVAQWAENRKKCAMKMRVMSVVARSSQRLNTIFLDKFFSRSKAGWRI